MKILSTPTASTKNGMTSMVRRVVGTPAYPHTPKEQNTEHSTTTIPPTPRVILLSNYKNLKLQFAKIFPKCNLTNKVFQDRIWPRAMAMYTNITA